MKLNVKKTACNPLVAAIALCGMLLAGTAQAAEQQTAAPAETRPDMVRQTVVAVPAPTLKDTVQATLSYNPTVKAFQEYRQAAVFDLKRARSGWFPRLDARAGWGVEQWDDSTARNDLTHRDPKIFYGRTDTSLVASQTIWDGLATLSRYRFSESRLDSAAERLYDNAEGLSLDAVLSHIEIYRQRRLVALSEINVKNHQAILKSQQERQRGGAASMADVTQTQGRLARAQSSLTEAQLALALAISNYKMLTRMDPGDLVPPTPPVKPYESLEVALTTTRTNNSKIKASMYDVDANIAQKDIDKANFQPQIYLEAGHSYSWQVQGSDTYNWGTGIQIRAVWNLYNGHYDWYNMKADKAKVRQSKKELFALHDNLDKQTTDTWNGLISARELTKFYTNAVEFNTQTRDMYLEQFNIGQRSLLDVLDSENELYNTSMLLVTSQLNQIASQYRLITLGGDLLSNFEIDKTKYAITTDDNDFSDKDYDSKGFKRQ